MDKRFLPGFYSDFGRTLMFTHGGRWFTVASDGDDIEPSEMTSTPAGAKRLIGLPPDWIVYQVGRINSAFPWAKVSEADMLAACGHAARNPAPEEKPADPTLSDLLAAYHLVAIEEEEAKERLARLQSIRSDRFQELQRAVREMMKSPTGNYRTDVAVLGDYALYLDRGELVIREAKTIK